MCVRKCVHVRVRMYICVRVRARVRSRVCVRARAGSGTRSPSTLSLHLCVCRAVSFCDVAWRVHLRVAEINVMSTAARKPRPISQWPGCSPAPLGKREHTNDKDQSAWCHWEIESPRYWEIESPTFPAKISLDLRAGDIYEIQSRPSTTFVKRSPF